MAKINLEKIRGALFRKKEEMKPKTDYKSDGGKKNMME